MYSVRMNQVYLSGSTRSQSEWTVFELPLFKKTFGERHHSQSWSRLVGCMNDRLTGCMNDKWPNGLKQIIIYAELLCPIT